MFDIDTHIIELVSIVLSLMKLECFFNLFDNSYINNKKLISSLRPLFVNFTEILKLIAHKMPFSNHEIKPANCNTFNKAFAELNFELNHSLQTYHSFWNGNKAPVFGWNRTKKTNRQNPLN